MLAYLRMPLPVRIAICCSEFRRLHRAAERFAHAAAACSPSNSTGSRDLPLALTVAAAIMLIVSNTLPLMELHVVGRFASTTIAGGAYEMWMQGQRVTSALVAFCALIAPVGYVSFMLTLLIAVRFPSVPRGPVRCCAGWGTCKCGRCSRS